MHPLPPKKKRGLNFKLMVRVTLVGRVNKFLRILIIFVALLKLYFKLSGLFYFFNNFFKKIASGDLF